jgi:hypothetical protein
MTGTTNVSANSTYCATALDSVTNPAGPTRLGTQVASTARSSRQFSFSEDFAQSGATSTAGKTSCVEIPLYYKGAKRDGDRIEDIDSFTEAWATSYEHLTTQTLSEREVLDVLNSGILQRKMGKNLAPEFVDAIARSIQSNGDLTPQRLRKIAEVICHLPQQSWADEFGEHLKFSLGPDNNIVAGYLQAQLTLSQKQRDEKIANGELLTNAQWQCLCEIIDEGPSWLSEGVAQRLEEEGTNRPLVDLKDATHLRPSPGDAQLFLSKYWQVISEETHEQLPNEYENKIHQLLRCILEKSDPTLQTEGGAEETVSFEFLKPVIQQANLTVHSGGNGTPARNFPLLAVLEEIERKSDFYDFVSIDRSGIPKGLAEIVMYAGNVFDVASKLPGPVMASHQYIMPRSAGPSYLGIEHQARTEQPRRLSGSLARNTTAKQPPASSANFDMRTPTASIGGRPGPVLAQHNPAFIPGTVEWLEELARQTDALLTQVTHSLTGWRPVEANDDTDPRPLLEVITEAANSLAGRSEIRGIPGSSYGAPGNPYRNTVIDDMTDNNGSWNVADVLETMRVSLAAWLQGTATNLATMGVMTWSSAAGFVQQHPVATATGTTVALSMVAIYAAVNEFYARWFPDKAQLANPHYAQEADPELRKHIIEDVSSILNDSPELAQAVRARVTNSTYADPHKNPQLVSDIQFLLQRTVASNSEETYKDLVDEAISRNYYAHLQISKFEVGADGNRYIETEDIPANSERRDIALESAEYLLDAMDESEITLHADQNLKARLLEQLESNQNIPLSVPTDSWISTPLNYYQQTLNDPKVLTWLESKGFALDTLNIHEHTVSANVTRDGVSSTETFSIWDTSGWWQVSAEVLAARKVLDPADFGLPYVDANSTALPCNVILDFYRVIPPDSDEEAKALASRLKLDGWPELSAAQKAELYEEIHEVQEVIGEAQARELLIQELGESVKGMGDHQNISLSGQYSESAIDSSLANKCLEPIRFFNQFLLPEIITLCEIEKIDCKSRPLRISEGKIEFYNQFSRWQDLTDLVTNSGLNGDFTKLLGMVKDTGNTLYSSMSFDLQQILNFRGFGSPKTAGEIRNVIRWLQTALPRGTSLGNYGAELLAGPQSPIALTCDERTKIISLTDSFFIGTSSIIDELGDDFLLDTSVEYRRNNADWLLSQMFEADQADAWGQELLQELNWYGAGETAIPDHYHKLLLAAIKLAVDPDCPGKPGNIAGYDLYQPENLGRDINTVRAEIESHLIDNKGVTPLAAPLIAHLFLADIAPEFLPQNIGEGIGVGSTSWMTLRLGVSIAEVNDPGSSRVMTAEQLMALALLAPTTPEQQLLFNSLTVDIVITWGAMNGVIPSRREHSYTHSDYSTAATSFATQRSELAQALEGFTRNLVTRREIAIAELGKVFSKDAALIGIPLEELEVEPDPGTPVKYLQIFHQYFEKITSAEVPRKTLVEAYMDGDLSGNGWKMSSDDAMTVELFNFNRRKLPDLNKILSESVDRVFNARSSSFITAIKSLITALPLEDRRSIELGEVKIFTLREEVGLLKENETPANQETFRGRQGTILRSKFNGKIFHFEIFPGRMTIIKRDDLFEDLKVNGEIKIEKVRVSKGGVVNAPVQRGTEQRFDYSAYAYGTEPIAGATSNKLIVEQLGATLPATTVQEDPMEHVPDSYFSNRTRNIASLMVNDNFLVGGRELLFNMAKGQTTAEQDRAYWEGIEKFLWQLIPFVGCVSDLRSGERMGFINGAFGCFTDLTSILNTVVGGLGRITTMLKTSAPVSFKVFESIKVTGSTLFSAVNPFDGVPGLVAGGARAINSFSKILVSGMSSLTDVGYSRMSTCLDRLRGFFGGAAAGAGAKLPRRTKLMNVMGRVNGTRIQATSQNGTWYAMDNFGNPFGRGLENFIPLKSDEEQVLIES